MPRNLWIAYIATWVIHLGYVFVMSSGFSRLKKDIDELKKR